MATAEGKAEKKFAHLLQPIRSLSENWDIDIATELEDYLVKAVIPDERTRTAEL
jgi:hypothetical protein